ncbi:MAG: hypothetical protein ACI87W_001241 [Halieaceae bacterium]|jgi:hypothetical protein
MQLSTALQNPSPLIFDDDIEALEEMSEAVHGDGLAEHTVKNEVRAMSVSNERRP